MAAHFFSLVLHACWLSCVVVNWWSSWWLGALMQALSSASVGCRGFCHDVCGSLAGLGTWEGVWGVGRGGESGRLCVPLYWLIVLVLIWCWLWWWVSMCWPSSVGSWLSWWSAGMRIFIFLFASGSVVLGGHEHDGLVGSKDLRCLGV
jgi:hypothetical protein